MSHENVEILSRGYEALNRRDFAAVRGVFHADAVWRDAGDFPEAITQRGSEAPQERLASFESEFAEFRVEPEEFIDLGERVLVLIHISGVGRMSGLAVDARTAHLVTMRDGKVADVCDYLDRAHALQAAGLAG